MTSPTKPMTAADELRLYLAADPRPAHVGCGVAAQLLVEHDEQRDRADEAEAEVARLSAELEALRGDHADVEPQSGWVLWDAEGHWVSTTASEFEDLWATMNVTERERLSLVVKGYFVDKLDPDGWRAFDAIRGGANVAGVRDQWLVAKAELVEGGGDD
jgi:hypothetical protein